MMEELYNKMVVVRRVDLGIGHESVWYLSDLSDNERLFLIDASGNRMRPLRSTVEVRLATEREIAEDTLRSLGFRGSLDEVRDDKRRDDLIRGLAAQTTDLCRKEASKWSMG